MRYISTRSRTGIDAPTDPLEAQDCHLPKPNRITCGCTETCVLTSLDWEFGDYDAHFGIQTVNRTTQERSYKKSFFDLVDFVNARTL